MAAYLPNQDCRLDDRSRSPNQSARPTARSSSRPRRPTEPIPSRPAHRHRRLPSSTSPERRQRSRSAARSRQRQERPSYWQYSYMAAYLPNQDCRLDDRSRSPNQSARPTARSSSRPRRPRWIQFTLDASVEIRGFCDASGAHMAAYLPNQDCRLDDRSRSPNQSARPTARSSSRPRRPTEPIPSRPAHRHRRLPSSTSPERRQRSRSAARSRQRQERPSYWQYSCGLCQEDHALSACERFRHQTPFQRYETVERRGYGCLLAHQDCRLDDRSRSPNQSARPTARILADPDAQPNPFPADRLIDTADFPVPHRQKDVNEAAPLQDPPTPRTTQLLAVLLWVVSGGPCPQCLREVSPPTPSSSMRMWSVGGTAKLPCQKSFGP
ncbi:serine/arginine repetitive matrix protein 1-like [Musca domestica]|uniref:Serine/arginine repetitive matrix protein 1-like n=1 Tax=Musca domestica TaxID=7370 RepID=A0ABM3VMZ7_MUSDO|nr:serine/arginine repetitive matrix protein 1-like [Musca domestica]